MGDEEEGEPTYKLIDHRTGEEKKDGSRDFFGEGYATFVNGDTFDGSFANGNRAGKGLYTFKKNGDAYDGHYELNLKHGFGKMTYTAKTGEEEEGEDPDPTKPARGGTYLGYFAEGKRGGKEGEADGTFTYVNGDTYVGQWSKGKKHGRGTYTYASDGTKLVGEWENGKITTGRWVFPNGTFYSGRFRYNKPFGKGVWVFNNGNQLTGAYDQKEQKDDEDGGGGEEEEGATEKPDPKVTCSFKHGKCVMVQGGSMFYPKFGA